MTPEPSHPRAGADDATAPGASCRPPDGLRAQDLAAVPRSPGVLDIRAEDGRTLAIWVTGDLRALVARRLLRASDRAPTSDADLGPEGNPESTQDPERAADAETDASAGRSAAVPEDDPGARPLGSPRADLRAVASEIRWHASWSTLEAEADALTLSRDRLPAVHREMADRLAPSWLTMDDPGPDSGAGPGVPRWRVGGATDGPIARAAPERRLGPFVSAKAARQLAEQADEAAELCRYPAELAQAPAGSPCAYKDMGRCPGACDGSEPMAAYRERLDVAVTALTVGASQGGLDPMTTGVRAAIAEASIAMDFERAAALKARLDALDAFARACASPRTWARFGALGLFAAARRGWVRVVRCEAGVIQMIATVRAEGAGDATDGAGAAEARAVETIAGLAGETGRRASTQPTPHGGTLPDAHADPDDDGARASQAAVMALVMRELGRAEPVRARGVWVGVLASLSPADLRAGLRRALRLCTRADGPS